MLDETGTATEPGPCPLETVSDTSSTVGATGAAGDVVLDVDVVDVVDEVVVVVGDEVVVDDGAVVREKGSGLTIDAATGFHGLGATGPDATGVQVCSSRTPPRTCHCTHCWTPKAQLSTRTAAPVPPPLQLSPGEATAADVGRQIWLAEPTSTSMLCSARRAAAVAVVTLVVVVEAVPAAVTKGSTIESAIAVTRRVTSSSTRVVPSSRQPGRHRGRTVAARDADRSVRRRTVAARDADRSVHRRTVVAFAGLIGARSAARRTPTRCRPQLRSS